MEGGGDQGGGGGRLVGSPHPRLCGRDPEGSLRWRPCRQRWHDLSFHWVANDEWETKHVDTTQHKSRCALHHRCVLSGVFLPSSKLVIVIVIEIESVRSRGGDHRDLSRWGDVTSDHVTPEIFSWVIQSAGTTA